jgi:hypothetical protein
MPVGIVSGFEVQGHPGTEYPVFVMRWNGEAYELITD